MAKLYYTTRDIATKYGVSPGSAYALVRRLPPHMVVRIGRLYRIDKVQFDEYMAEQH